MTIRNLEHLFQAKSVALIGASSEPDSVGSVIMRNLLAGGFAGPVMPVNPKHRSVHGVIAYPDIASLPLTPDLGVICTPPDTVPGIVAEVAERGTRGIVIVTAGFGDSGSGRGRELREGLLAAAHPHLARIVGPNCLGVMIPGIGLDASFAPALPEAGSLAFVAQSGAIIASVTDWARLRGIGFSHLVSLGNMIDVDFGDMLDYLANDLKTRAILLYIESVTNTRKFLSAARAAARSKPVVVVKAGRRAEGARAAQTHTGSLTGVDAVYDAVFRRAGILRVNTLAELFDAVAVLSSARLQHGERLAILTNGGGMGVLATDTLIEQGGRMAELAPETIAKLDAVLPPTWSRSNPVDIIGDAPGARYADALEGVLEDEGVDAILVISCPTAMASSAEAAQAVVESARGRRDKLILTSWVGGESAAEARRLLTGQGWSSYETPEQAVRAFMYLVNYSRARELLMQTPPSLPEAFTPDTEKARSIVRGALDAGREWLTASEAMAVLRCYAIPTVREEAAPSVDDAVALAGRLGTPVALKIASPDITHKSDVGGVALDLRDADAVRRAAVTMLERVSGARPDARIEGFTVAPMVERPHAFELIVGLSQDPQFGPTILFGHGGTATEVINDTSLELPPLNMKLARELIGRARIHEQLRGYRDHPGADLTAIAVTLTKVSQIAIDFAEIAELDINPLLADETGVIALDARIKAKRTDASPLERLAIRPYPKDLEETITIADGRRLFIRPIVPEDEPSLQAGFAKLTPEEVRLRFLVPMKTLNHVTAARFTQLDYDREMALVLTEHGIPGETEIYGVVRISADPDIETAEYAIIVRRDLTGQGLGAHLMQRIIDYSRGRGIRTIFGIVLRENSPMLNLCDQLGFVRANVEDEPSVVRVAKAL
jgi:acetyltransferase